MGIGLVLLVCGMAIALWDRPAAAPRDGSASLRKGSVLPYP